MARKKSEKAEQKDLFRRSREAAVAAGLTEAEGVILETTCRLWSEFVALPELHGGHQAEVHLLVHAIQDKILTRPALRAFGRFGLLSSGKAEDVEPEGAN